MASASQRRLAYMCLAGTLALLPVQEYVEQTRGEPYPALVLPRFSGGGVPVGEPVSVLLPRFTAQTKEGRIDPVPPELIFGAMPPHIRAFVIRYLFGPTRWDRQFPEPTVRGGILRGRGVRYARDRDRGLAWRAVPWVQERLRSPAKRRGWTAFSVSWVERRESGVIFDERTTFAVTIPLTQ